MFVDGIQIEEIIIVRILPCGYGFEIQVSAVFIPRKMLLAFFD